MIKQCARLVFRRFVARLSEGVQRKRLRFQIPIYCTPWCFSSFQAMTAVRSEWSGWLAVTQRHFRRHFSFSSWRRRRQQESKSDGDKVTFRASFAVKIILYSTRLSWGLSLLKGVWFYSVNLVIWDQKAVGVIILRRTATQCPKLSTRSGSRPWWTSLKIKFVVIVQNVNHDGHLSLFHLLDRLRDPCRLVPFVAWNARDRIVDWVFTFPLFVVLILIHVRMEYLIALL